MNTTGFVKRRLKMVSARTKATSRRRRVVRKSSTRRPATKKKTVAKKPAKKSTTKTLYVVDAKGRKTNH